jgi:hypothetical protein
MLAGESEIPVDPESETPVDPESTGAEPSVPHTPYRT